MQQIQFIVDKLCKCLRKTNKKFFVLFLFVIAIFIYLLGEYNFSYGNMAMQNRNYKGVIDRIEGDKLIIECSNNKIINYSHKNLHGLKEGDCVNINNDNIKLDISLKENRKDIINELYSNLQTH